MGPWSASTCRVDVLEGHDRLGNRGEPAPATLDKGYDVGPVYEACEEYGCAPVLPLRKVKTKTPPGPPACEHGTWTFAGAEANRRQTKWRCPTGECKPASRWIKTDRRYPLIPRPKVALYADLLMLARLA